MSGCAVASDSSLLSPSKIHFYNDADDVIPISGPLLVPPGPSLSTSTLSVSTVVTVLDNHFTSQQPAIKLAGVRRTTHLSKPSARVRDAAEALNTLATTGKCKANNFAPQHHVICKTIPDPNTSDNDIKSASDEPNKTTDDARESTECDSDTDSVQAAYDRTREMGDGDRKVSPSLLLIHRLC